MKTLLDYAYEAVPELQSKTLSTIQVETALKWGGRALAARALGQPDADVTEYAHEAVEHAALSGDDNLLRSLRQAFREHQIKV